MSKYKYNSLGSAVKNKDSKELEKMLDDHHYDLNSNDIDPQKKDKVAGDLNRLLYETASFETGECSEVLINHGADPNWFNPSTGETTLFQSVKFNSLEQFRILVNNGANVNQTNSNGNNPIIHWLDDQKEIEPNEDGHFHYDIVKEALNHGFDVNQGDLKKHNSLFETVAMINALSEYDVLTETMTHDIGTMMERMVVSGGDLSQKDFYNHIPSEYVNEGENLDPFFELMEDMRLGDHKPTLQSVKEKEKANENKNSNNKELNNTQNQKPSNSQQVKIKI